MADSVASIAVLPLPLSWKLRLLRLAATRGSQQERLVRWAAEHPQIATDPDWCRRAWWGAAAGEIVRHHLYDPRRRAAALRLVERVDVAALEAARKQGGVIVAAAHLGPPKFLMNWLLDQQLPLLIWTNTRDMPASQAVSGAARFLDPLAAEERGVLLVKSALHLRGGGVLLGAADHATGDRLISLERLGREWRFSLGLPVLARRLGIPVVVAISRWHGQRIRVNCMPLEAPYESLSEEAWNRAWIERYWAAIEPLIARSPENLRSLRWAVERVARPWEATKG